MRALKSKFARRLRQFPPCHSAKLEVVGIHCSLKAASPLIISTKTKLSKNLMSASKPSLSLYRGIAESIQLLVFLFVSCRGVSRAQRKDHLVSAKGFHPSEPARNSRGKYRAASAAANCFECGSRLTASAPGPVDSNSAYVAVSSEWVSPGCHSLQPAGSTGASKSALRNTTVEYGRHGRPRKICSISRSALTLQ